MFGHDPWNPHISKTAGNTPTEGKALDGSFRWLYFIKRISRSTEPLACESVRGCIDITAPTLSHHMKELEVAGLITVRRSGKFINYEFRRDVLESFLASLRREFM
jgi:ArsR family transcriptional regulator, arsenate/arsenite/antimonite-responsive transcriptional repressor